MVEGIPSRKLKRYMNGLGPLTWETIKSSPEKARESTTFSDLRVCVCIYILQICIGTYKYLTVEESRGEWNAAV